MCSAAPTIPHRATVHLKNAAPRLLLFTEHQKKRKIFVLTQIYGTFWTTACKLYKEKKKTAGYGEVVADE